jgi:uncharacterized protein
MLAHSRPRLAPRILLVLLLASLIQLGPPLRAGATESPASESPIDQEAAATGAVVPVHVAGIRMVGPDQVLLFLADEKEERAMPMAVGRDQGVAIYLGKEHASTPRPLTHDLLVRILKALGAVVEKVTVTGLKQDTYFAEITLRSGQQVHRIDARPSDAIALALRLDAPAFAAAALLRPVPSAAGPSGIRTTGDHRLGFSVQQLEPELAESIGAGEIRGVLVASVRAGAPAAGAGVRRGDVLEAIDESPVSDLESFTRAAAAAAEKPRFRIWRDGTSRTLATP